MDKRWYPVAFSVTMVGCSGDVDTGSPSATGGQPNVYYGVGFVTGGASSIDTGTPAATGGHIAMVEYGPISVNTGGITAVGGGSCTQTTNAVCTSGNGTSYSCTSSAQPEQVDPSLICNTNGAGDYCCIASSTCSYDPNLTGCESGSLGYSCAIGDQPPDATDNTLVCSVPTTTNGLDEYCCFTNTTAPTSAATCLQDPSVAGCAAYGFSCTGTDAPDADFSGITCSTGTPGTDSRGGSATLYCCAYQ